MNVLDRQHRGYPRKMSTNYPSGGTLLAVPKTPAERLALYVRLAKMKTDFYKRQAARADRGD